MKAVILKFPSLTSKWNFFMSANLLALSPLDGRYAQKISSLTPIFSEFGLIKYRVMVEISWLKHLYQEGLILAKSQPNFAPLDMLINNFSPKDAEHIKTLEATTNHDVKAVEYFLQKFCEAYPDLHALKSFWHFACTSEDINNLAYALTVQAGLTEVLIPAYQGLSKKLRGQSHEYADIALLARTHGQAATPTTLGKELAVFVARLDRQLNILKAIPLFGKCHGAVGNFNAHMIAYPEVDWPRLSANFVQSLGLNYNAYVTQIEPHDFLAEIFHALMRIDTVLIDLCRDMWSYISLGYFSQKLAKNEVGSSTMPHKVNPIDFENAEGNLGLANALFAHMADKLPISRLQRDLSDSTVLRNIGSAFGYALLASISLAQGLNKLELAPTTIEQDLNQHWEILAEAVQTLLRRYEVGDAYEQLKALTRGQNFDVKSYQQLVKGLSIPKEAKERLLKLTPGSYTGLAKKLAETV
jgi:adenylosuccinate lyase